MYCMFQHEKCKVYMKYTFLSIQVVKYFCSEYTVRKNGQILYMYFNKFKNNGRIVVFQIVNNNQQIIMCFRTKNKHGQMVLFQDKKVKYK